MRVRWIAAAAVLAGCLEMNEDYMEATPPTGPSGPTSPTTSEPPTGDPTEVGETTDEPDSDGPDTEESSSGEPPGFCGDGVQQLGEDCDDGNDSDLDFCNGACQPTVCGDGITQPEFEECDDANLSELDECSGLCKFTFCGDGSTQPGEECDDGDGDDTNACLSTCMVAVCGDGETWLDHEECDDGNQLQSDACVNACQDNECGDGLKEDAVEECDDGNAVDLDGCDADCALSDVMYIFVTSTEYTGDMGGWMTMDDQIRADAAGLPMGQYRAWLSDIGSSAGGRIGHASVPYIRPDGIRVADDWFGLTSGSLLKPIEVDEFGLPGPKTAQNCGGGGVVYTGTKSDGSKIPQMVDCSGWMSTTGQAAFGRMTASNPTWTEGCIDDLPNACATMAPIYCVQEPQ
jgi:cysteine-rich repeat protein